MTKEIWNNIEKLSELRAKYNCFNEEERPYYHALSVGIEAIKALEQEPTTKNDLGVDYVSKEKVRYMITGGKYSDEDYEQFIDRLVNELEELPSVTPQEQFKPMVEIDLDYVIKQKYIEREVLDKIRAKIIAESFPEDEDKVKAFALDLIDSCMNVIKTAPTIIEADKESKHDTDSN